MIAHLRGREQALEPFGWTGRQAEWIALACLHSGVFTRAQLSAYLRIDRWQALRFVRAMSERRLAADETLEGRKGLPDLRARDLPRARRRGHPPPPDRFR